MLLKDYNYCK